MLMSCHVQAQEKKEKTVNEEMKGENRTRVIKQKNFKSNFIYSAENLEWRD